MPTSNEYRTFQVAHLAEIDSALLSLANDINTRVIPNQTEKGSPFQKIRIELWVDSGRIIAFPSMSEFTERTDICGSQIICTELAETISELDESDWPDSELDAKMLDIHHRLAALIRSVIGDKIEVFSIHDSEGLLL